MREVHTLAGGEIRLQLSDIHVQRTAKTERGRQEEMTYASKQYNNVYVGSSTSKILQQMSNINLVSIAQTRQAQEYNCEIRELKQGRHAHDKVVRLHGRAPVGQCSRSPISRSRIRSTISFPMVEFASEMLAAFLFSRSRGKRGVQVVEHVVTSTVSETFVSTVCKNPSHCPSCVPRRTEFTGESVGMMGCSSSTTQSPW